MRVEQVVLIANRVVLVPVGAGLTVRDDLVSTVKDIATRYSTRKGLERELQRYEKRGAAARNRLEKLLANQVEKLFSSASGLIT
jgi:hypothetical protein